MQFYRTAMKIDQNGELHLSEIPFQAGEEVEVVIRRRESEASGRAADTGLDVQGLPPVTRSLLGIARGWGVDVLVTRDPEDFRNGNLLVLSPQQLQATVESPPE